MKKSEERQLRVKANDLRGLMSVKDYLYNDGPSRGMRAFDLKNGRGMDVTVLADRGLDIPALYYKGVNLALNNKVAVSSPYLYHEDGGREFVRHFYGGLLTTCGLTYAGSSTDDDGRALGVHGRADHIPAENVSAGTEYDGDEAVLRVRGQVREARAFGEHLRLTREITLRTESNCLEIHDVIENLGFVTAPLMMIYHINFGYPMLDTGAMVYVNSGKMEPRTDFAREKMGTWDLIEEPEPGREEQCYFHTQFADGDAFAMLHNEKLGLAAAVHFDPRKLPLLCQWKMMCAGDYCLGLEPTTSGVASREDSRKQGILQHLEPGEAKEWTVRVELLDDADKIREMICRAKK